MPQEPIDRKELSDLFRALDIFLVKKATAEGMDRYPYIAQHGCKPLEDYIKAQASALKGMPETDEANEIEEAIAQLAKDVLADAFASLHFRALELIERIAPDRVTPED